MTRTQEAAGGTRTARTALRWHMAAYGVVGIISSGLFAAGILGAPLVAILLIGLLLVAHSSCGSPSGSRRKRVRS